MKQAWHDITNGFLFTDQYQLSMAQLYFRMGLHEKLAQFDHFFRKYPDYGDHQAGYCINAGLEWMIHWLRKLLFRLDTFSALPAEPHGRTGVSGYFLHWLRENGRFDSVSIRAIPEGRGSCQRPSNAHPGPWQ